MKPLGKYFHTYSNAGLVAQGKIIMSRPDCFFVEVYDWPHKGETIKWWIPIFKTATWRLYRTKKDWAKAFEMYCQQAKRNKEIA